MLKYIYYLFVALSVYTDSFLTPYMGAFGFSVIPTAVFILYPILYFKKIIFVPSFARSFYKLINYTLIISFIFIGIFIILGVPLTLYGEFLPAKTLKLYLTFLSYVMFIIIIVSLGIRLPDKCLYTPFFVVFVLLTIFGYFEYKAIPHAFMSIHTSVDGSNGEYWRIRLLTQESSHTAPIIEIFFLMSAIWALSVIKSKFLFILSIVCFAFQFSISSSKSLAVVVMTAFVIGNFNYFVRSSLKNKIILVIILVPLFIFIGNSILSSTIENIQGDIDNATSTATRSLTMVSGYATGIIYPFGTGFSSYLYIFPKMLTFFIDEFGGGLNIEEVMGLINGKTDHALAAQSFFAQSSSYWGIMGSCYFMMKLRKVYKNSIRLRDGIESMFIKTCFVCVIINMLFTSGFDFCIQVFVGILIIRSIKKSHHEVILVNSRNAISSKYRWKNWDV